MPPQQQQQQQEQEEGCMTVPPVLHQAWVGGPVPSWVERRRGIVEALCQEEHVRYEWWDDTRIRVCPHPVPQAILDLRDRYDISDARTLADMLRMWVVLEQGGMWMDMDIHPLVRLRKMVCRKSWVSPAEGEDDQPGGWRAGAVTQQAVFGLRRNSPIARYVLEHAMVKLEEGVRNPHFIAGPRAFFKAEQAHPHEVAHHCRTHYVWSLPQRRAAELGELDTELLRLRYPQAWFLHVPPSDR